MKSKFKWILATLVLWLPVTTQAQEDAEFERVLKAVQDCTQKRLIPIVEMAKLASDPLLAKYKESTYTAFLSSYPMLKDSVRLLEFPLVAQVGPKQESVRICLHKFCTTELRQIEMDDLFRQQVVNLRDLKKLLEKK